MTDIPVGSPPVPPGRHAAPGGWYPDPLDARRERYWDGWQWSKNTRDLELPAGAQGGSGYPAAATTVGYPPPQVPPDPYGGYPPQQNYSGQYPAQQGQPGAYPNQQGQQGSYPQGPYPDQQGQPGGPQPYPQGQPSPYPNQPGPYPPAPAGYSGYPQGGYATGAPGQRAVLTADGVPLAGWWFRVLAVLLDWIIVSVLAVIPNIGVYSRLIAQVRVYFDQAMQAARSGQPTPATPDITTFFSTADQHQLTLVGLAVALIYNIVFLRWKAATPGKLITGLRVVPVDRGQSREPLRWGTIVIRTVIWVVPRVQTYLLLFRLADSLFPLWHPKRQALHDLAAGTQVVRRR